MAEYHLSGEITAIQEPRTVGNNFTFREFVVMTPDEKYPQPICLQVGGKTLHILDDFHIGDQVRAEFNLRGREWQGDTGTRFFNTLSVWRMELLESRKPKTNGDSQHFDDRNPPPISDSDIPFDDKIPF